MRLPQLALVTLLLLPVAQAQLATHGNVASGQSTEAPRRTRLILKDGTYQVVTSYKIVDSRVQYISAERGGETEEIPLELVDLDATRKWEQRHTAADAASGPAAGQPPALDPELAREEASRAALTPEVAPNLRLVAQDTVLALDTWRGAPELVPLMQSDGDLNRLTGHSILRGVVKSNSSTHEVMQLQGEKAAVQMHVPDPAFYIRLDDATDSSGDALTVDTGGASSSPALREKHTAPSRYAIVRVEVRNGVRVVASFSIDPGAGPPTGKSRHQNTDAIAVNQSTLPGGHWARLVPAESLLFGEYCLVEILSDAQINLSVWDFGVHPTAPENRDVLHPEERRPAALEHRPST